MQQFDKELETSLSGSFMLLPKHDEVAMYDAYDRGEYISTLAEKRGNKMQGKDAWLEIF